MAYDLGDYVEVSARLEQFKADYPDGRLVTEIVSTPFDGMFLAVKAYAYRSADDERPATGLAWEPVPGKTPYTKDSELMNAETSAWGRALIAGGYASAKTGIASANEVRNRSDAGPDLKEIRQDLECPACGSPIIDQNKLVDMMTKKNPDAKTPPRWACSNPENCTGGKGKYGWGSWEEFPDFDPTQPTKESPRGDAPTDGIHWNLPEKEDADPHKHSRWALDEVLSLVNDGPSEVADVKGMLHDHLTLRAFTHPLSEQQARLLVDDVRSELGIKGEVAGTDNPSAGLGEDSAPLPDAWVAPKSKYVDAMRDHLYGVAIAKGMNDAAIPEWILNLERDYPDGVVKGPKQAEALVAWADGR